MPSIVLALIFAASTALIGYNYGYRHGTQSCPSVEGESKKTVTVRHKDYTLCIYETKKVKL